MEQLPEIARNFHFSDFSVCAFLCAVQRCHIAETVRVVQRVVASTPLAGLTPTGLATHPGPVAANILILFPRATDDQGFLFLPTFEGIAATRHAVVARLGALEPVPHALPHPRAISGEVSRLLAITVNCDDEEASGASVTEVSMWSGLAMGEAGAAGRRRGGFSDTEQAETGLLGTLTTLQALAAGKPVVVCVAAAAADRIALVTADLTTGKVLFHGTSSRYVTRRGQGGSQATADARKTIKSAGAQLRRAGAAALAGDAERLLRESGALDPTQVSLILTAGAGATSRRTFVRAGSSAHIAPSDERLRRLPFGVAKPTYAALVDAVRKLREARCTRYSLSLEAPAQAPVQAEQQAEEQSAPTPADSTAAGADALAASGAMSFDGLHPLVAALADNEAADDECVTLWREYLADWVVGWDDESSGEKSGGASDGESGDDDDDPSVLFSSQVEDQWALSLVHTAPLYLAWTRGRHSLFDLMVTDVEALPTREDRARVLNAVSEDMDFGTALHALCADNEGERAVRLLRAGADPTIKTVAGKRLPAKLLTDDAARMTLRRYATENPQQRWDWRQDAAIAPLLDEATAAARAKRGAKLKANAAARAAKAEAHAKEAAAAKREAAEAKQAAATAKRAAAAANEERRAALDAVVRAQKKEAEAMGPRDAARLAATRRFDGVPKCDVCRDADLPMVPYKVPAEGDASFVSVCSVGCARTALG